MVTFGSFMKSFDWKLIALVGVAFGASQLDYLRFENRALETGGTVRLERCSLLTDGQELWERYKKDTELLTKLDGRIFKDTFGNYYECKDTCRKI